MLLNVTDELISKSKSKIRKIIHIDMDAFFASVEQRDEPAYQNKPLIVGGKPDSRGVVAACSYEARKFGIHSAMPCARAARLCPQAIFVRPRFEAYRSVSQQIHAIFREFTDRIEPLSLDEAYLDVSDSDLCDGSATLIAKLIKQRILEKTHLNASAGISYNKFLAKIASDMDKPDGLYLVRPEQGASFVATLPIGKFYGVGKVTETRMKTLGIHLGSDLRQCSLDMLRANFGKAADYYYQIARGEDNRSVQVSRQRKSIAAETTFATDLTDSNDMLHVLRRLSQRVASGLKSKQLYARTLTLKVRYSNFQTVTRSHTFGENIQDEEQINAMTPQLLNKTEAAHRPVRLLGVSVSSLERRSSDGMSQLDLNLKGGYLSGW